MTAFGAGAIVAAGADPLQIEVALNISGSDLCLIAGAAETSSLNPAMTFEWDDGTSDETPTGTFATLSESTWLDSTLAYFDDPTAANSILDCNFSTDSAEAAGFGAWFTAAADVVATDDDTAQGTSGTSATATPGNVSGSDIVVDFLTTGHTSANHAEGANQTEIATDTAGYMTASASYRNDGSAQMDWTFSSSVYGHILIAARVPDSGGGGGGVTARHLTLLGVGS